MYIPNHPTVAESDIKSNLQVVVSVETASVHSGVTQPDIEASLVAALELPRFVFSLEVQRKHNYEI